VLQVGASAAAKARRTNEDAEIVLYERAHISLPPADCPI